MPTLTQKQWNEVQAIKRKCTELETANLHLRQERDKATERAREIRLAGSDLFIKHKALFAQFVSLKAAVLALLTYRDQAGPLGFQLEKADDHLHQLRGLVENGD